MKKRLFLILVVTVLAASFGGAQVTLNIGPNLHGGKIGFGLDGITGSPNVLMKYFFNNRLAGELIVGAATESPSGEPQAGETKTTGVTFRGGLNILYHLLLEQVSPYVGAEALFQSEKPAGFYVQEPDTKNTVHAALVLGGEYFMNERFSFGIKHSVGVEFGVPKEDTNTKFSTSTLVTGRFYLN